MHTTARFTVESFWRSRARVLQQNRARRVSRISQHAAVFHDLEMRLIDDMLSPVAVTIKSDRPAAPLSGLIEGCAMRTITMPEMFTRAVFGAHSAPYEDTLVQNPCKYDKVELISGI